MSVTIYIKLLAGQVFPILLESTIISKKLYNIVYSALPKEVNPGGLYPLQLFRNRDDEKDSYVIPLSEELITLEDNEVLNLFVQEDKYKIKIDRLDFCEFNTDGSAFLIDNNSALEHESCILSVYYGNRLVHRVSFFVTPFNDQLREGDYTIFREVEKIHPEVSPHSRFHGCKKFHASDPSVERLRCYGDLVRGLFVSPSIKEYLIKRMKDLWKSQLKLEAKLEAKLREQIEAEAEAEMSEIYEEDYDSDDD